MISWLEYTYPVLVARGSLSLVIGVTERDKVRVEEIFIRQSKCFMHLEFFRCRHNSELKPFLRGQLFRRQY